MKEWCVLNTTVNENFKAKNLVKLVEISVDNLQEVMELRVQEKQMQNVCKMKYKFSNTKN